jgi:hypothetical protein
MTDVSEQVKTILASAGILKTAQMLIDEAEEITDGEYGSADEVGGTCYSELMLIDDGAACNVLAKHLNDNEKKQLLRLFGNNSNAVIERDEFGRITISFNIELPSKFNSADVDETIPLSISIAKTAGQITVACETDDDRHIKYLNLYSLST